jgi:hypothetical protein
MANPVNHARSSVVNFGGQLADYLQLHMVMDSSKTHWATAQHRSLFHHEYGVELMCRIFGDTLTKNGSIYDRASTAKVAEQHIREDFSRVTPTVQDWFEIVDIQGWMLADHFEPEQHCMTSVANFGGKPDDYLTVHEFLDEVVARYPNLPGAWVITHSTFGLALVEAVVGPYITRADGKIVPTRTIAEKHILSEYRHINTVHAFLSHMPVVPWMGNQARALSGELDGALTAEEESAARKATLGVLAGVKS